METQVELIHAAFDDAEDWLLREAEKFEEKHTLSKKEQEHIKLMEKMGFSSNEKVLEFHRKQALISKSKKLTERVLYYKKTYPFLKFLTESQLEAICETYNLIYAPVQNYKGDVPEKNLKEIANAQPLKEEDKVDDDTSRTTRNGITHTKTTKKTGLFIAGPKSDFNLEGLEKKKGLRGYYETLRRKEPEDPIVFRYVRGGIQVLSKWGPEAEDPMLTNPLDN